MRHMGEMGCLGGELKYLREILPEIRLLTQLVQDTKTLSEQWSELLLESAAATAEVYRENRSEEGG